MFYVQHITYKMFVLAKSLCLLKMELTANIVVVKKKTLFYCITHNVIVPMCVIVHQPFAILNL